MFCMAPMMCDQKLFLRLRPCFYQAFVNLYARILATLFLMTKYVFFDMVQFKGLVYAFAHSNIICHFLNNVG